MFLSLFLSYILSLGLSAKTCSVRFGAACLVGTVLRVPHIKKITSLIASCGMLSLYKNKTFVF